MSSITPPNLSPANGGSSAPDLTGTLTGATGSVIDGLFALAGVAAVIYLIWAGAQYILAAGTPEKSKQARAALINAVIGVVIVVSAYAIIRVGFSLGSFITNII